MQRKTPALLLALALLHSGCATSIEKKFPANRFESPETRGRAMKGEINMGFQGGSELRIVNNLHRSPPPVDAPNFQRTDFDYLVGGAVSLEEWFDVSLKLQSDAPTMLGFKAQLAGHGGENAKQGNLSLAVTGAGGYASENGESVGFFGEPTVRYDTDIWVADTSLIAGYRLHDQIIFYTGPFYQHGFISGSVNSPSQTGNVFSHKGDLDQWGANFGLQLTIGAVVITLDGSWASAEYRGTALKGMYGGLLVGGRF